MRSRTATEVKIGRTKNIERRVAIFNKTFSFPIELLQHIKTVNYEKIELTFHKHYHKQRVSGEWFKLDINAIEEISKGIFPEEIRNLIVTVKEVN